MLHTRQEAAERLAWVVAGARAGAGAALLLTGAPGAGKSTLLDAALLRASDALVLRCTGSPVESGLPHAALHALLHPLVDDLQDLPEVQREALSVALGLRAGPPPTPFLLGAATLSLLAATADRTAVVLAVDDLQWVDEASVAALGFVARRLAGERVAVLVVARAGEAPDAVHGLPVCDLAPLTSEEGADLLVDAHLEAGVLDAVLRATAGNPLASVEMARALDADQRAGRRALPDPEAALFSRAVAALGPDARQAAALAALGTEAPPHVLAATEQSLGISSQALLACEGAGLLTLSAQGVRWRHPLARSAVVEALTPEERRAVLAALVVAGGRAAAPRSLVVAWRVAAATGPDEELAVDLEDVARAASAVGDHPRAARDWHLAAGTGTDHSRRGDRLLESAEALMRAGRPGAARERFDAALECGLCPEGQARAHLARGRAEHTAGSPRRAVAAFQAAAAAATDEATRTRAIAEGVLSAMYATDAAAARSLVTELPEAAGAPGDRLLAHHARGVAAALAGDGERARSLLDEALAEVTSEAGRVVLVDAPDLVLWVVTAPLFVGGDPDAASDLVGDAVDALRRRGDLLWLPRVVRLLGHRHLAAGRPMAAFAAYEEAVELSRAATQTTQLVEALSALAELEALRGEREACLAHVEELEALLAGLEVPFLAAHGWWARGLLHLGLGEPALAVGALSLVADVGEEVPWREGALADLVEALLLDGRPDQASGLVATGARASSRHAGAGRSAALLEPDDARAVEGLLAAADTETDPFVAARCRLLAGERLRRAGQRKEARDHLRAAEEVFTRFGARPWRSRADEGLRASGESLSSGYSTEEALTGAELRVAGLVAEGRPTREVAALLFLSTKTVEFHLSRIYRKLGVRGRAELAARLASSA